MESGRHMWWRHLAWVAAAMLAPAIATAAVEAAASDTGARMLRLAENVYVIEHEDATDEWPHGNTGVIVGRTGVFVVDSGYLPSRARADIALIRRVTDKPVRFLLTTHWHFDHNNGAIAYVAGVPGRNPSGRAQHRALDRIEPGVLEGPLHCPRHRRGARRSRR